MLTDEEVMKFVRPVDQNIEQTKETMKVQIEISKVKPGLGIWCAHQKEDDEFIGWGYLNYLERVSSNPIELGYRLHTKFWRKGYASEVAKAVSELACSELGVGYLCAVTHQDNEASKKVLIKNDFEYIDLRHHYDHEVCYFEKIT